MELEASSWPVDQTRSFTGRGTRGGSQIPSGTSGYHSCQTASLGRPDWFEKKQKIVRELNRRVWIFLGSSNFSRRFALRIFTGLCYSPRSNHENTGSSIYSKRGVENPTAPLLVMRRSVHSSADSLFFFQNIAITYMVETENEFERQRCVPFDVFRNSVGHDEFYLRFFGWIRVSLLASWIWWPNSWLGILIFFSYCFCT